MHTKYNCPSSQTIELLISQFLWLKAPSAHWKLCFGGWLWDAVYALLSVAAQPLLFPRRMLLWLTGKTQKPGHLLVAVSQPSEATPFLLSISYLPPMILPCEAPPGSLTKWEINVYFLNKFVNNWVKEFWWHRSIAVRMVSVWVHLSPWSPSLVFQW